MADKNMVQEIVKYFQSEQWAEMMRVMQRPPSDVYHIHIYVDTKVNPWCLLHILKCYFKKIGCPVERKVELFTSGQISGCGTIHGVEPKGMPHFDMIFRYSDDCVLGGTVNSEPNVQYWDSDYMEKFHAQFPFKTELTADELAEVERYFAGKEWEQYCQLNENEKVVHIHANVETSIHPNIIAEHALKAMDKQGWKIEYAVPVAFKMRGLMHGKIVFAGIKPEKMFDIAWMYNPTVTLHPSTRYWLTKESPAYDARTMAELPELFQKNAFQWLSLEELNEIERLL